MVLIARRLAAIAVAALYLAAGTASLAAEPGPVFVTVEGDGNFEVLYSRAKSTATGMVIFGLIGYGVEESSRNEEDNKREGEILQYIPDHDCREAFVAALAERLEEKGFTVALAGRDEPPADASFYELRVKVHACGFKLTNSTSELLSTFHAVTYSVLVGKDEFMEKSDVLMTGKMSAPWPKILANAELAAEEFKAIREKSGRRVANQLIYHNTQKSAGDAQ